MITNVVWRKLCGDFLLLFGLGFFGGFFLLVDFLIWFVGGFFPPKIIFPSRTQVQNTEYCFIYEKVDDNDGYLMGKK